MQQELNATHLFERPTKSYHNSEHWWTSLFSMLLLHFGSMRHGAIPIKKYESGPPWKYSAEGFLDCTDLNFSNVLVEPRLDGGLFGLDHWKHRNVKPDVLAVEKRARKATLVECKTIREVVKEKQFSDYLAVRDDLRKAGWDAELYYLLSIGTEGEHDMERIEGEVHLILWEDVLRLFDEIDHFKSLFDVDLRPYYETPQAEPMTSR
jgi:hypothetical protein